ncbi:hypothetical protein BDP81DRAFT_513878 [Colletotrichum phormii]|uniref:Low temperature requirement A n=1 Tax=Colletotrichum phormii TaxID=359342 RepID=A0AAJ0EJ61_9PEZI|nr:uncharacterized protein BDP81DRAFT_513878 [Colletotrichum phormii]KAK1638605.1 hypothetical protein BDP81DRAFT_513878 [Colletotrichum phormii]
MAKLPSSQVRRVDSDSSSISWGLDYLQEEKIAPLTWIESPVSSADEDTGEIRLFVRHNANTIELFSDLFFVANLETFTQTHSITDLSSLAAYLGFFAIIWFTWFQITLHDVRFSIDSGYERMCKILQFCLFVGFALVGSSFSPGTKEHNNANFQLLCNILFATRLLLVAQYSVALHFVRKKTKALNWPLSLTIVLFIFSGGSFYSMTPAFSPESGNGLGIYYVCNIILVIEVAITLGLSSIWKNLSFKHTHLTERMGLFTLVIIGEGAIGATKVVGVMMGDTGLRLDACLIVGCIVFILMFNWMLYFDNPPECKFGTVRQQIWAVLHFPFHLGMIGVVEGSQQIALAWQVLSYFSDFFSSVRNACATEHQDGQALTTSITTAFEKLKMPNSAEIRNLIPFVYQEIYRIGNTTDICAPANITGTDSLFVPPGFERLTKSVLGVLFESYNGVTEDGDEDPGEIAHPAYSTVYIYYWSSFLFVVAFFAVFILITRHKDRPMNIFDKAAVATRGCAALFAFAITAGAASERFIFSYLKSGATLPTVAALLLVILAVDRFTKHLSAKTLRRNLTEGSEFWERGLAERQLSEKSLAGKS